MSGWFSVKHGIRKHPIFKGRPDRLGAWVAMLDEAAYADTEQDVAGAVVSVRRGELCASQAMLEEITGLSRQQLRTFLSALEREGAISTRPASKSTKSRTIVTFCNYGKYQTVQPKTNQTSTKDQPIKEQGNNIPPSEGAVAPVNPVVDLSSPTAAVWAVGKAYLSRHGVKNPGANIGLWLKSVTPVDLLAAIQAADRARTEDPIPYITEALKPKSKADSRGGIQPWPDGSLRALAPDRVQEFLFGRWENRSDLTEAMVAEHPKYIGRSSAYRSEAHAV